MASDANHHMVADQGDMMVYLWDLGPKEPKAPKRPDVPQGKEGNPEYDLAVIEFKEKLEGYEQALKEFRRAKDDHAAFRKTYGGPYEIRMWSCDAADALARDEHRYRISSRTRGYEKLKNRGLPEGLTPGHGHEENLRREQEGDAELLAARRRDPVFGTQEMRQ
jgi:hypothetical protein